jgi:hypothetical protein
MPEPVCVVCGFHCIAMCPYCKQFVCAGYQMKHCSDKHEAMCPPAKEARSLQPLPPKAS